jgi:hypothetical protein
MKMTSEHYSYLLSEIDTLLDRHKIDSIDTVKQEYEAKGLSMKRMRWDLVYYAKLTPWICDNLYNYLDDTHIDTALRKMTNTK